LERFVAASRASDVTLTGLTRGTAATPAQLDAVRHIPGVIGVGVGRGVLLSFPRAPDVSQVAAVDSTLGGEVDRPRIIAGRAANPRAADEVTIGETLAAQLHLGVGDHLDAASFTPAQVAGFYQGIGNFHTYLGPHVRLRIVGIDRRPLDLGVKGAAGGVLILTPAFNHAYASRIGDFGTLLRVRTRDPAVDVPRVVAAARRIFAPATPDFDAQSVAVETQGANSAISVLTVALWVFAAVAALAGAVAIGIVLSREISSVRPEQSAFRALGLTRTQRGTTIVPLALVIAGAGAVLAVVVGLAMSPLFPIGVARRADPHPGFHIDWLVLGLTVVAVVVVVFAVATLAAVRVTRPTSRSEVTGERHHPSRLVDAAARAGLAPTATTGLRMALEPGSGDTSIPIRSAYFGAIFGVLGVVAVLVFATSLNHLGVTPRFSGYTWDFSAVDNGSDTCNAIPHGITRAVGVTDLAGVCVQDIQLDGQPVSALAFHDVRGTIQPSIVEGRAPTNAHEIALGAKTLHTLGKTIGDTVHSSYATQDGHTTRTVTFRIVGQAALPALGGTQPLADGAVLTSAGFAPLNTTNGNLFLVGRFAPGTNHTQDEHQIAEVPNIGTPTPATVAVEIARLQQIDWFPATLCALLGTLALLAVGHALVTAVRHRRRDLALLKTLGFDRRQVRATVAWQATILGTVGLIIGIPLGLTVGDLVWDHITRGLGIPIPATTPALAIALTIPVVLVLVNLIAYLPAHNAAQTRPAIALRTE
jgi:FtsX-like permease family